MAFKIIAPFSFQGKLNVMGTKKAARLTDSTEVPPMAEASSPATNKGFKGIKLGFRNINNAVKSGWVSLTSKTAGAFTCCVRPIATVEFDLGTPSLSPSYIPVSPKQPLDVDLDEVAVALVILRDSAAATGKKVASAEEAYAVKTEGLAKYQQHQEQLKANLEAADAADAAAKAAKASAGTSFGSSEVLEQIVKADTEAVGDDVSGERIDDNMWDDLLADPELAAMVAEMQAGKNAC